MATGMENIKRTVWECDVCGHKGFWSDAWRWYGSYKDLEDKGRKGIKVTCSDNCSRKLEPIG
jgi:hypothetical protein